jgi:hypothetical protein
LGDPLKGNLLLFFKPLHLEAQQVSIRIEVRRHQWRPTNIRGGHREDGINVELVGVLAAMRGRRRRFLLFLGHEAVWACWAGPLGQLGGPRPGKPLLSLFSASYSFSIFCFAILNSS